MLRQHLDRITDEDILRYLDRTSRAAITAWRKYYRTPFTGPETLSENMLFEAAVKADDRHRNFQREAELRGI